MADRIHIAAKKTPTLVRKPKGAGLLQRRYPVSTQSETASLANEEPLSTPDQANLTSSLFVPSPRGHHFGRMAVWPVGSPSIQPKLAIQRVCSECEKEMQQQPAKRDEEENQVLQTKPLNSQATVSVQRQEQQLDVEEGKVQAKEQSGQTTTVTPNLETWLQARAQPPNNLQTRGRRGQSIQRKPNPLPAASPTPADYREMVINATQFMRNGAEFYALLTNVNQARIDTIVQSLNSTIITQEGLIRDHLNNDATLLQNLRAAYTSAIRALLSRAAAQIHTSVFSQYTRHIDRIPLWAWPNASALGANNDAQKRAFITTVAATFNDTGVFSNLGAINQAKLEEVLTRLNATVTELETMISSQLGGDATLRQALHNSFRSAIGRLLSRASTTIGQSDFNLYMRYRYGSSPLIPDWVDQSVTGVSTPIPVGAAADPLTGEVTMSINGMRVLIQTDTTQSARAAVTNININAGRLSWRGRNGAITFTPPLTVPEVTIRTAYGPGLSASATSGYGRGTTAADQAAGNTSLGFHEGSHGRSYLDYLQNHTFPVFAGTGSMTIAQFRAAVTAWDSAVRAYSRVINRGSELTVDCVGTTIETYYRGLHQVSRVNCTP